MKIKKLDSNILFIVLESLMEKFNTTAVSVIIPTYNSWQTLRICINSIQKQTLKPREIIIIDNHSTDGTTDRVKKFFPRAKVITMETNTGVTGGRNEGIRQAKATSDCLLFFDHDMIADKNMLKELVRLIKIDPSIGIITPKILYFGDKRRIWSAGTGINLWSGQVLFRGGTDVGQYETPEEVQVAPAVLLVKRSVINRLKAFDDRYFATYEDTDFCFRARAEGFKVFYTPTAFAYHKIPHEPKKESLRLLSRGYWIGRNRILFMKDFSKNFFIFLLFLPIFIIYYLRLALRYGRLSDWLKLVQGVFAGIVICLFSKKTIFSGERPSLSDIDGLHLVKYKFALDFCRGKKLLEIGCGTGYGSNYLAENGVKIITACDVDPSAISFARRHNPHSNINFLEADVEKLELAEKYDVVVAFEVIEHLQQPEKLITIAKKSLKKGGFLILSTPNKTYSSFDGSRPSNPYHVYEYYPNELEQLLDKYFETVNLYGVVLKNKQKAQKEILVHKSLRWKTANFLTKKRFIRKIMNFLPEYPKRIITGESKLLFSTEDFQVLKNKEEESSDFVVVCR